MINNFIKSINDISNALDIHESTERICFRSEVDAEIFGARYNKTDNRDIAYNIMSATLMDLNNYHTGVYGLHSRNTQMYTVERCKSFSKSICIPLFKYTTGICNFRLLIAPLELNTVCIKVTLDNGQVQDLRVPIQRINSIDELNCLIELRLRMLGYFGKYSVDNTLIDVEDIIYTLDMSEVSNARLRNYLVYLKLQNVKKLASFNKDCEVVSSDCDEQRIKDIRGKQQKLQLLRFIYVLKLCSMPSNIDIFVSSLIDDHYKIKFNDTDKETISIIMNYLGNECNREYERKSFINGISNARVRDLAYIVCNNKYSYNRSDLIFALYRCNEYFTKGFLDSTLKSVYGCNC